MSPLEVQVNFATTHAMTEGACSQLTKYWVNLNCWCAFFVQLGNKKGAGGKCFYVCPGKTGQEAKESVCGQQCWVRSGPLMCCPAKPKKCLKRRITCCVKNIFLNQINNLD